MMSRTKLLKLAASFFTIVALAHAQTQNYVAKFNASGGSTNSLIFDNGNVGIGTTSPAATLDVNGTIRSGVNNGIQLTRGNNWFTISDSTGYSHLNWFSYFNGTSWIASHATVKPSQIYANTSGIFLDTSQTTGVGTVINDFTTRLFVSNGGNVGIGTTSPGAPLAIVANPTATTPQVRISPVGLTGSSSSLPSYLDFYSTFDAYPFDQGPRRTATIKAEFSGGVWGNEALAFEVGAGGQNDAANELTERMRIAGNGNIGIGTTSPAAKLEINGNVKLTSGSGAALTFADGTTQSTAWTGALCGGDYAESVGVTGERTKYEPGDVMVIDTSHTTGFVKSTEPYSSAIAGIYSTKPGAIGRRTTDPDAIKAEIPMAMVGIVPTKVSAENGAIHRGDLLVTASIPGRAMKGTDRMKMTGAIVGKALGNLDSGLGVIDVLVSLQ